LIPISSETQIDLLKKDKKSMPAPTMMEKIYNNSARRRGFSNSSAMRRSPFVMLLFHEETALLGKCLYSNRE
ncbi:hypothetical protein, partial [Methanothrix sp.]|uniref:hypothetical protein n=1 Tax=Methanothrix sp. TaxID=90426 RepID=UPI003BB804F4